MSARVSEDSCRVCVPAALLPRGRYSQLKKKSATLSRPAAAAGAGAGAGAGAAKPKVVKQAIVAEAKAKAKAAAAKKAGVGAGAGAPKGGKTAPAAKHAGKGRT